MTNKLTLDDVKLPAVTVIIGDSLSGKTTMLNQIAKDLGALDGFYRHRLDISAAINLPKEVARLFTLDIKVILWDLPETGLSLTVLKEIPETLATFVDNGFQVFVTTHSLFLLREIEMVMANRKMSVNWVNLTPVKTQSFDLNDIGDLPMLDEELRQSDRYMNLQHTGA